MQDAMKIARLTADRLRQCLTYDCDTGVFKRTSGKRSDRNSLYFDGETGSIGTEGYRYISVDGRGYLAHRLACLYMTGQWPAEQVDHRDGNRANNAWTNLRQANYQINAQNIRTARANNKTGLLGVSRKRKKFRARIELNGTEIRLGVFDSPQEAHLAYVAAKREIHAGCTL